MGKGVSLVTFGHGVCHLLPPTANKDSPKISQNTKEKPVKTGGLELTAVLVFGRMAGLGILDYLKEYAKNYKYFFRLGKAL
ncbi:hypothetical protein N8500_07645 [Candidatus Puniceispirillum sp.]|nr:hypothetical protein [Candidatus Puniceispirillum sp.]